jgi:redox-sensitive bicupin YhaK (pirin superfamily)
LESWHTFSFAGYHDPAHLGFRSLRVINQDRIAPGAGFPTHPHRDMEIFSYVVEGRLRHADSLGNTRELLPGQIQLLSAGRGVTHSEHNPSSTEPAHILQIWIHPREKGLPPAYTEWHPPQDSASPPAKTLAISPDGRDGSAPIRQDAHVFRLLLRPRETVTHELLPGRGLWIQAIRGSLTLGTTPLSPGDGARTEDPATYAIAASGAPAEALLFDLA